MRIGTMISARGDTDKVPKRPWSPISPSQFGFAEAHHLTRRVGFGGSRREIQLAFERGLHEEVERVLSVKDPDPGVAELDRLLPLIRDSREIEQVAGWWLLRMVKSTYPLREKLALFWHDHFATSLDKVAHVRLMFDQYWIFQERPLGPFDELLSAMSVNPAMILWLDGNANRKGHPNENFARELLELFSLGIGNYTENDVQEAARAFSGWHVSDLEYQFRARDHDFGEKNVLGVQGPLDGDDVIRLCAKHDATSRFLASKLLKFFLHPDPPKELVDGFSELIRKSDFHLGDPLKTLFESRVFYSKWASRSLIKSPTEFLAGAARTVGAAFNSKEMSQRLRQMGQALFRPPTVAGWDGDRHWMSSATWLAREATVVSLLEREDLDLDTWLEGARGSAAADKIHHDLFDGLLPKDVLSTLRSLGTELVPDASGMRAFFQAAMMLPEFHCH